MAGKAPRRSALMSEQTYTRIVQGLILFVVVAGAFYAQPAASAVERVESGPALSSIAREGWPCRR